MAEYSDLLKRNASIQRACGVYPLFLFREGNITLKQQAQIKLHTPEQDISFVEIPYDFPTTYNVASSVIDEFGKGYRLMCRFNTTQIWAACAKLGLSHFLRVDEDCVLDGDWKSALNAFVASGAVFQSPFFSESETHSLTNKTLPQYIFSKYGANAVACYDHKFAYTSVYVAQVKPWTMGVLKCFLDGIEDNGGILRYRWGDLPILSVACKMYLSETQFGILRGVAYTHGSHDRKVTSL